MSKEQKYADDWYSRYIRLINSIELGGDLYCRCITCNRIKPIKQIQCGHFIPRGSLIHRYNHDNTWPQCVYCNKYDANESLLKYEEVLINKFGVEYVRTLKQTRHHFYKISKFQYIEIKEKYKKLCKQELADRGIKSWASI